MASYKKVFRTPRFSLNQILLGILIVFAVAAFVKRPDLLGRPLLQQEDHREAMGDDGGMSVKSVIDGDTIILSSGEKVRLIGIDTPERGEYFYAEARDHLKQLIDGKEVTLKKDVSQTDRYGRLLRHIYIDETWINRVMIEQGYAHAVTFPPDVAHDQEFRALEQIAREERKGLWAQQ